jgi:toxin ParE1/3/4
VTIVSIHPIARLELSEAVEWYESKEDGVGLRFLAAVDLTPEQLERRRLQPLRGFPGIVFARVGKSWPYRLFIDVEVEGVLAVLAFAHDRRKPGYWLGRRDL